MTNRSSFVTEFSTSATTIPTSGAIVKDRDFIPEVIFLQRLLRRRSDFSVIPAAYRSYSSNQSSAAIIQDGGHKPEVVF
jgi:hypothetical protein